MSVFHLPSEATPAFATDDAPSHTTPIVVRVDDRFNWSDAGIGIVAGAGAALAAVGGVAHVCSSTSERLQKEEQSHDQ